MKKLFLHIGLHKTGSTTLQTFLHQNSNNLCNSGYLYPKTGIRGTAHHNLAWLLRNDKQANLSCGTWKELHEEIETTNLDNIIVTSEDFEPGERIINSLKSELKPYEVKIILYIKRQERRLESQYIQYIRQGLYWGDILSFCEKQRAVSEYQKLLEPWKQGFGIDALIVRPLEQIQIPNICHDFLKIIGITNLNDFNEIEDQNIRQGRKTLEVLKLANKIYKNKPREERKRYLRKIIQHTKKHWSEEKSYRLLSYSDASKILEWYEQSNQAVAREYLGREDGVLFYEQLEPYSSHKLDIADLSKEELLSLIQAIESTEQVKADKEELLSLIQELARVLQKQKEIDGAIAAYQKAIELSPDNPMLKVQDRALQRAKKEKYNVVICATFKNEAPYILEWIAYHRVIKVDHFLIYDNDSNDETSEILQSLDRAGIITYINWPSKPNLNNQLTAYQDAWQKLKEISEWVAFIDADEFIVPHQHNDLKSFLSDYEDVAGIAINWKMFGSSGQLSQTDDLVIERFKRCAEPNYHSHLHFKTIAKTNLIEDLIGVHACKFAKDNIYVYPDRTPVPKNCDGKGKYINHQIIQINHYFTKSKSEWALKRARGRATVKLNDRRKIRPESLFYRNDRNEDEDLTIFRFLEKTKQEIKFLTEVAGLEQIETRHKGDFEKLNLQSTTMDKVWSKKGHLSLDQFKFVKQLCLKKKPEYVLETGFCTGRSACSVLLNAPLKQMISVDINLDYIKQEGRRMKMVLEEEFPQYKVIEGDSKKILNKQFFEQNYPYGLDWVTVDGDHTYKGCIADLENVLPHLKKDGLIIVDDFESGPPKGVTCEAVNKAVKDFCHKHNLYLSKWNKDGKGFAIIQKTASKQLSTVQSLTKLKVESVDSEWTKALNKSPIRLYAGDLSPRAKKDGWMGVSINHSDEHHIKHDLTKPFPISDGVVDAFQSEDVFEHIHPSKLLAVTFPEIYRIMKPGGFIRISVPDYRCDFLLERSWKDEQGKPYYDPGPGRTGKIGPVDWNVAHRGHVWFPTYEQLWSLIEMSPLRYCQANWLHYYDCTGKPVLNEIDYSKGFIKRTPDHDPRVQNPRSPMSIVVDLYK